jgi:hypothetical protein
MHYRRPWHHHPVHHPVAHLDNHHH